MKNDDIQLVTTESCTRNCPHDSWWRHAFLEMTTLCIALFVASPIARADCRQGCDSGTQATYLGEQALQNFQGDSSDSTAVGYMAMIGIDSLGTSTTETRNTAVG